jgi:hypothetical protein
LVPGFDGALFSPAWRDALWAKFFTAAVVEMTSRVRLAFAAACPDATLIRYIAAALMPAGP